MFIAVCLHQKHLYLADSSLTAQETNMGKQQLLKICWSLNLLCFAPSVGVCVVLINDHIQATVYHVIRHNHYLIHVAWNLKEFHKRFQHLFYPIFSVTKIKNLLCFISQSGNPKSTQCHSSCSIDSEIAAYEPDNTFWLTLIFILNSELKAVITWLSFLLQIQNGCSNLLFFVCIILTIP